MGGIQASPHYCQGVGWITRLSWLNTLTVNLSFETTIHAIRAVCFGFERARHQGIFFLVKGTLWWNCKFVLEHFQGTKALTRGHRGNRLCCLREVSGLCHSCLMPNSRCSLSQLTHYFICLYLKVSYLQIICICNKKCILERDLPVPNIGPMSTH